MTQQVSGRYPLSVFFFSLSSRWTWVPMPCLWQVVAGQCWQGLFFVRVAVSRSATLAPNDKQEKVTIMEVLSPRHIETEDTLRGRLRQKRMPPTAYGR